MSTGKLAVGHIGGRLYIRWFLDKDLLRRYLDSDPGKDDVVGITAEGLRLEISAHAGPEAAKAALDLHDTAVLLMQTAKGAA